MANVKPIMSQKNEDFCPSFCERAQELAVLALGAGLVLLAAPVLATVFLAEAMGRAIDRHPASLLCAAKHLLHGRIWIDTLNPTTGQTETKAPSPKNALAARHRQMFVDVHRRLGRARIKNMALRLGLAIEALDASSVATLAKSGAPLNLAITPMSSMQWVTCSPLEQAVRVKSSKEKQAHKRRAVVSTLLLWGSSPRMDHSLSLALSAGDLETFLLLLKNGACPNSIDNQGLRPLHHAALNCAEAIPELLNAGADPCAWTNGPGFAGESRGGDTALHLLAKNKIWFYENEWRPIVLSSAMGPAASPKWECLLLRLEAARVAVTKLEQWRRGLGGIDAPNGDGHTALNLAALLGAASLCHALLDAGADPTIADNRGLRPRLSLILSKGRTAQWPASGLHKDEHEATIQQLLHRLAAEEERVQLRTATEPAHIAKPNDQHHLKKHAYRL